MASLTVRGTVQVPGDKSISHRALILGALATRGATTTVRHILQSADVHSTAGALRALGANVSVLGDTTTVTGCGLRGLQQPAGALDCGNSGTTTRLLSGVVAGHPVTARFEGDSSLSRRPMQRVARPLTQMGARFEFEHGDGLPMTIHGAQLNTIDFQSPTASAQIKSAILLAGLVSGVPVIVREPERSRDHTERMLAALGVTVSVEGTDVSLSVSNGFPAFTMDVPGDPSSAAFFAGLAALAESGQVHLERVCLNPTRTGFLHVLARMGAGVAFEDEHETAGDRVGTVIVTPDGLRGVTITRAEVPSLVDELPLVACLAAYADGDTVISGAEELRVKESDRIAVVVANLRALGVDADERPDGLVVRGGGAGRLPLVGQVVTHGDHRIAMAFGVLSAIAENRIVIDDPSCVAVSYPHFWEDLARVAV